MTLTGENKHTQRKTCSSATLPTKNPTRTGKGWNQGHQSHSPNSGPPM